MADAGGSSAAHERLSAALARDLNAISDANKFTRKRGLAAIEAALFDSLDAPPPAAIHGFLSTDALRGVLAAVADASEMNRELAVRLLTRAIDSDAAEAFRASVLPVLLPVLVSRIGRHPSIEDSEEIRLALSRLLDRMLAHDAVLPTMRARAGDLADICRALALDPYHSVKVEGSAVVVRLATGVPEVLHTHVSSLITALLPNVSHQRGPVRLSTLNAIHRIVPLAAEALTRVLSDHVLPVFRQHARFDRVSTVRSELVTLAADWLTKLPGYALQHSVGLNPGASAPVIVTPSTPALTTLGARAASVTVEAHLMSMCLALMADEDADVTRHALEAFTSACAAPRMDTASGSTYTDVQVAAAAAAGDEVPMDESLDADIAHAAVPVLISADVLPAPFRDRAAPVARTKVSRALPHVLPLVLGELADWTTRVRLAAAGAMRNLIIFSEAALTSYLDAVIAALCTGSRDDDSQVRAMLNDAGRLLGVFVPSEAQLNVLIPQLAGKVSGLNNAQHYSAALAVLASALSSMTAERLRPHANELVSTLCTPHLAEDEPSALRANLAAATREFVRVLHSDDSAGLHSARPPQAAGRLRERRLSCASDQELVALLESQATVTGSQSVEGMADLDYRTALLTVILHLLDAAVTPDVVVIARETAQMLRKSWHFRYSVDMYATVMWRLLPSVAADASSWTKASPSRRVFDTALRVARPALAGRTREECQMLVTLCVDVFGVTLAPSKDAELRVAMLALLDDFILAGNDPHSVDDVAAQFDLHHRGLPSFHAVESVPSPVQHAMDVVPTIVQETSDARLLDRIVARTGVHVVSHTTVDAALAAVSDRLIREALLPNAVWRTGMVAATIRKVTVACMLSLARRQLLPQENVVAVLSELLPVLRSCVSDEDGTTRHMTAMLMMHLFSTCGRCLEYEAIRATYIELMKRLDDSNDAVRIAACGAIRSFRHACPLPELRGGPTEHIIDALLVHLDDTDRAVQEAVHATLLAWLTLDLDYAAKHVREARTKHRDPSYCDRLLAEIEHLRRGRGGSIEPAAASSGHPMAASATKAMDEDAPAATSAAAETPVSAAGDNAML